MPDFKLFDHVDKALITQETKEPRASRTPAVWPSEASADRIDKTVGEIVGKCHRAAFGRMVGWPVTNTVDPVGAWRWVTGRLIESHLVGLSKDIKSDFYVASGVKHYVKEIYLPLELDLVVMDPETKKGWIVECKTIYGYMASQEIIKEGKPKLENLMQTCLYLLEIRTGKRLKEIIRAGLAERNNPKSKIARNRIEASESMLDIMDDGPLGAKLLYLTRDTCERKEFNITVEEECDGSFYPAVDGMMWKTFTVESIYERYRTLQNYWFIARAEAEKRLAAKGITPPDTLTLVRDHGDSPAHEVELTEEQKKAEYVYLEKIERETAALPVQFWPPAEYQWAYSPEKIELLRTRDLIGKKRYEDWKKKRPGKDRIGDWTCLYCPFKKMCVPHQNPNWAYQLYDMDDELPQEL